MSWKCRGVTKDGNADFQHDECEVEGRVCPQCGLFQHEVVSSSLPISLPIIPILISLSVIAGVGGLTFSLLSSKAPKLIQQKSARYGIDISYPKSWELREPAINYPPSVLGATKDLFQFLAPDSGEGSYQENILVKIEQIERPFSLDEFADAQVGRIRQLGTYTIESDQKVNLNGSDVREIIYSGNNGQYFLKRKRIIAEPKLPGDYFILITYTADQEDYDVYLSEVDRIFKSVELLE
ncbi:MAG: hypothetical protein F6K40_28230 [Okeania sp. SIO3I5]|uniref:hypothetical protein n=1 Tax=Okeania sp. SIO3I5 TaxID=2607805 RepID=UPI0013B61B8E|nr:hypothetical protein [Okeania sp. SIO3I5]NEQ39922.1 hypothetical protein [Okeania sp. SIO3I5]